MMVMMAVLVMMMMMVAMMMVMVMVMAVLAAIADSLLSFFLSPCVVRANIWIPNPGFSG